MTPPLKPALGLSTPRAFIRGAMPRGGRLLMTEKGIPAFRMAATAARVRSVSCLSFVTSVPSTSDTMADILVVGTRRDVMRTDGLLF